ncbi:hypothetical protein EOM81_07285 [bacterium]|nr:hypothetical protein [bacterium]
MGTNSILLAGSDSQSSTLENSNASESSENGCYGETVLPAEKYDCVRYPTEPAAKQMTASSDSPTSQNKSDATFSGFIGAVFALMALFSAGSAMAGSSGKGDVGVVGIIGILMVVAAMILGFATAIKFWPFLLLLFFCTMFDSKRGSSGSGCGCGCGLLLLLLMLGLL